MNSTGNPEYAENQKGKLTVEYINPIVNSRDPLEAHFLLEETS